jgi:hypothetical protein
MTRVQRSNPAAAAFDIWINRFCCIREYAMTNVLEQDVKLDERLAGIPDNSWFKNSQKSQSSKSHLG